MNTKNSIENKASLESTKQATNRHIEVSSELGDISIKILNESGVIQSNAAKTLGNIIFIETTPKSNPQTSPTLFGRPIIELTAIGSILTTIISLVVAYRTIVKYSKDHKLQLIQRNDLKIEQAIVKAKSKIENFYGPLNAHLEESRIIYEHFATEEKKTLKKQGDYFRTLRYLTNDSENKTKGLQRFKPHDQELLNHIIKISDQVIKLIEEKSGYVDNAALHILLGKLAAHYRIIKSASEGKLTDQAGYLENIVFPLEINGAINSELCKLTRIIDNEQQPPMITNKTIDFYDKNFLDYYHKTNIPSEMEFTYELVREFVENGSNILDGGCGVGRDTKYFIQHGFKVMSFDASKKMVDMCNEYPFAFCEHISFEQIKYPPIFDLVWACASLLHLDESEFKQTLTKLHRALKQGGVLYFSLKSKVNKSKSKGRDFFQYNFDDVKRILESNLNMTHLKSWSSVSAISDSERFENYIFKK